MNLPTHDMMSQPMITRPPRRVSCADTIGQPTTSLLTHNDQSTYPRQDSLVLPHVAFPLPRDTISQRAFSHTTISLRTNDTIRLSTHDTISQPTISGLARDD